MTCNPPTPPPVKRLPRPLRIVILLFSITLGGIFVLFAAAAVLLPSTKSGRIDWSQQREAEQADVAADPAAAEPVTTEPGSP